MIYGYDPELHPKFIKRVLKPYFKDIYKDLIIRVPRGSDGLDQNTFLQFTRLPELISNHVFKVFHPENNTQDLLMEDFANSMVKIYFSDFETKIKMAFNLIDFNLDGKLTKNEVKLFLVYAEIWP